MMPFLYYFFTNHVYQGPHVDVISPLYHMLLVYGHPSLVLVDPLFNDLKFSEVCFSWFVSLTSLGVKTMNR